VPTYDSPSSAMRSIARIVEYAEHRVDNGNKKEKK